MTDRIDMNRMSLLPIAPSPGIQCLGGVHQQRAGRREIAAAPQDRELSARRPTCKVDDGRVLREFRTGSGATGTAMTCSEAEAETEVSS
ncbi:hypothetical protein LX81_02700 [Palleronia aestuarii]|uniref:Uncharacterized protein n=1 Tax=Palleronia aestuarii TaxID=568105 RepID=A0A2W7N4V9_9RHOB|nr:hypothetical protein LX81_02700 [Palleronia aestuarii]